MMSLNVFSQNVIDSTSIQLKKPIARLVIKDLITGDSYKKELSLISNKVVLLENKIVLKDSIENSLLYKIGNLNLILLNKSSQLSLTDDLNKKLISDLRKQKIKTKLVGGVGIIAIIGTAILIK
tara:strand:+ start:489 stop:860 length:372 start_codon:yes stop_codon:yes gene_type:complete